MAMSKCMQQKHVIGCRSGLLLRAGYNVVHAVHLICTHHLSHVLGLWLEQQGLHRAEETDSGFARLAVLLPLPLEEAVPVPSVEYRRCACCVCWMLAAAFGAL